MNRLGMAELTPDHRPPLAASSDAPRKLNILLVEDDDADAYLISLALSGLAEVGSVLRARDGVQAIDIIEHCPVMPDLAIIDLQMPRKNGFDLLLNFASRGEMELPCAVLTSSTVREDEMRSRLRGADFFATKPKTMAELHTVLAGLIKRM